MTQAALMATGRSAHHKKLGLIAVLLAPAVVVAMIGVVRSSWSLTASVPPDMLTPRELSRINFRSNVLLEQVRMATLFTVFVSWAFLSRRRDPETHKRMM